MALFYIIVILLFVYVVTSPIYLYKKIRKIEIELLELKEETDI